MEVFWPTISETDANTTPLTLLMEQARRLGEKNGGKLQAELVTFPVGGALRHSFELVVPALGGYRFQIFSITFPPQIYPMTSHFGPDAYSGQIENEADFEDWLKRALSCDYTKRILANLLSQVNALAA
jgi:hypothetical protein